MQRRFRIEVVGKRGEYWAETVYAWLREEIADLLSQEYNAEIDVVFREADVDEPVIVCCGRYRLEEIPGEPGYLIEALKKLLDRAMEEGGEERSLAQKGEEA